MLIFHKPAPPKPPKTRSRAGCISCKQKKKKCNEAHPQCDRCAERSLKCEYEAVKPRRRRRQSSTYSDHVSTPFYPREDWSHCNHHAFEFDQPYLDWDISMSYTPYLNSETVAHLEEDEEEDRGIPESVSLARSAPASTMSLLQSRNHHPDLGVIAPSPLVSSLLEFSSPAFAEFSERKNRRALVDHFCNVMSHLIVFREDEGNPFRQLVLPLSMSPRTGCGGRSPVLDAIYALSSAHLENRGVELEEKSLFFHNRALQGLARLIDRSEMSCRDEILGAIMLLVYYEVLVQRGTANMVNGHLHGALTVMYSQPHAHTPVSLFLERAFSFYDVIAALSYDTAPLSLNPIPMGPLPLFAPSTPRLSFQQPNNSSTTTPLSAVDSLLGMATTLWPLIHRLAHLRDARRDLADAVAAGKASKASVLRMELEATSQALELALEEWRPAHVWAEEQEGGDNAAEGGEAIERENELSTVNEEGHDDDGFPMSACGDGEELYPFTFDFGYPSSPHLPSPFFESASPSRTREPRVTSTRFPTSHAASSSHKSTSNATTNTKMHTNSLTSIHHNALAYRHAALLFLARDIRALPRRSSVVQKQVELVMKSVEMVIGGGGPMSALLWPLFVGAVESVAEEERDEEGVDDEGHRDGEGEAEEIAERLDQRERWRKAFLQVEGRQGMRNIRSAWGVVEEVWRKSDLVRQEGMEVGEVEWRVVAREMGVGIVFG